MLLPEARACCADLDVRAWDDHAIRDAVLAASTALLAASPQVTPVAGAPGMWWVGANGFDAVGGEADLHLPVIGDRPQGRARGPLEQLDRVNASAADLMADQQRIWVELRAALDAEGVRLFDAKDVSPGDRKKAEEIFVVSVMPCVAKKFEAQRPEMNSSGFQLLLKLIHASNREKFIV
jgi:hypothetical protein